MGSAASLLKVDNISSLNVASYIGSIGPFDKYRDRFLELNIDGKKLKEHTDSNNLCLLFSEVGIQREHEAILKDVLSKLIAGLCVHPFMERWDGACSLSQNVARELSCHVRRCIPLL